MADLTALIGDVQAADLTDDYDAWQQASDALRAEMDRRIAAEHTGLIALVREYGDLRAGAVAEGEHGSPAEADLIQARAEVLLDRIAAQIPDGA